MVQSVNNMANRYGSVEKVGQTNDGRVVYKVTDPNGNVSGGLSVAQSDCDKFEHSYTNIINSAPKVEEYMKTHTQEDLKQAQKKGRWITAIGAFIGGIIPAIVIHKPDNWLFKILCTAAGTFAGLFLGGQVAAKVTIPPGAKEMAKATQELSKLDIRPIN